jgi:hypothetical protein
VAVTKRPSSASPTLYILDNSTCRRDGGRYEDWYGKLSKYYGWWDVYLDTRRRVSGVLPGGRIGLHEASLFEGAAAAVTDLLA